MQIKNLGNLRKLDSKILPCPRVKFHSRHRINSKWQELRVRVEKEKGSGLYFGRPLPIAGWILWGEREGVRTYASPRVRSRISVCLLLSIRADNCYAHDHKRNYLWVWTWARASPLRKPLRRRTPTLLAFPEYRDRGVGTEDDLATFWNFIMIRLKLKMHNDAHGSHNNGDNPVNGLLAFTPPSPARLFIHSERIISPRIVSLWSFLLWPADKLIARTISMNSLGPAR